MQGAAQGLEAGDAWAQRRVEVGRLAQALLPGWLAGGTPMLGVFVGSMVVEMRTT
jgi:hypothetical protein